MKTYKYVFKQIIVLFQKSKASSLSFDVMKPTTSKLLSSIMTIAVTPLNKSPQLHKSIKKPVNSVVLKKNYKKRKLIKSKKLISSNNPESTLKMRRLEKKN